MGHVDDLMARWREVAGDSPASAVAGEDLLTRWAQSHRRYHGPDHLRTVLDTVDLLGHHADDVRAVRLAAWFHDAVYSGLPTVRPGDDERASAEVASAVLPPIGLGPAVDEVVRLVLLTIDHDPAPDDANGAVLCDADLAVLGGSPEAYAAYAAAVREEYRLVPDDAFKSGRAAVLEALLRRDPLFHTTTGRQRWEDTARRNLGTELSLLAVQ
jgi:predicted metal-dependent HD superfamily phosphohydrolase